MLTNDYRFVNEWTFQAPVEPVFELIRRPLDYPRWWPQVFLAAKQITPGDAQGVGEVLEVRTRLWRPDAQCSTATTIEVVAPIRMSFETSGDFGGLGIWTLWQHGPDTLVRFNWRFYANRTFMRWFWWILRPALAAHHHRAMARGEESLRRSFKAAKIKRPK